MDPDSPPTSAEYYVLKQGEMFGPFGEEQLREGLNDGHFTAADFVQAEGQTDWLPLGRVLGGVDNDMRGAVAPDWISILKWAWLRLRYNLDEQSYPAGWVCLAVGAVSLALSRWPFVFWLPWFAAAVVAAVALLKRKHESHGAILLVAVVCIPLLFFIFSPRIGPGDLARPETGNRKPDTATRRAESAERKPETGNPRPESESASAVAPPPASPPPRDSAEAPVASAATPAPVAPPATSGSSTPEPVAPHYGVASSDEAPLSKTPEKPVGNSGISSVGTPVPAPRPAQVPAPAKAEEIDFVQGHGDSLVIVKGNEGSGSGFICNNRVNTLLYTNIHVIADIKQPVMTDLAGTPLVTGLADVAAGRDIARFALTKLPAKPLEIITEFESNVRIGDAVVVLGNSGGGGVVTKLPGEIVGIGPDRIEVSAAFIPGNSGSPIIHVKTGKVVGIATYLTRRSEEYSSSSPGVAVVRRFGYRIDNNPRWETLRWAEFRQDAQTMTQISALTEDVFNFLHALHAHEQPSFATETLRRPASEWLGATKSKRLSDADQASAARGFLNSLRAMVRGDVATAEQRLQYTYFRDELRHEREVRDKLYKIFDRESAELSSPSGQPTSYRKSH